MDYYYSDETPFIGSTSRWLQTASEYNQTHGVVKPHPLEEDYHSGSIWLLLLYLFLVAMFFTRCFLMDRSYCRSHLANVSATIDVGGGDIDNNNHRIHHHHHRQEQQGLDGARSNIDEFYKHETEEIRKEVLIEHFKSWNSEMKVKAEHIKGKVRHHHGSKSDNKHNDDDVDSTQVSFDDSSEVQGDIEEGNTESGYIILEKTRTATTCGHETNGSEGGSGDSEEEEGNSKESDSAPRRPIKEQPQKEETETPEVVVPNCCAICLDEYEVGDTIVWSTTGDCPHAFHETCLVGFLERNTKSVDMSCPCCRQNFCNLSPPEQDLFRELCSPLPPPPAPPTTASA